MLRIPYQSENFPTGTIANGGSNLEVTWGDILWAAITVGRPNRHFIFMHGDPSQYEAIFRWSLVRMSLEQRGALAHRLRRTDAAKTLDPTEKGAINYFLGMIFCKLFATKLLNMPWLLHLDVFRPQLNAVLKGRSRPDLIGYSNINKTWNAFECKGRISVPDTTTKNKAKNQAMRLVSVNNINCALHIGAITYFQDDVLNFYWRDPPPKSTNRIQLDLEPDIWRFYYAPIVQILKNASRRKLADEGDSAFLPIHEMDVKIGIHPIIAKYLVQEKWAEAHQAAIKFEKRIIEDGYQSDGLLVDPGDTWKGRPLAGLSHSKTPRKKLRLKPN